MHTPTTKMQSKKWLKKGTPGPIKAEVTASHTKQMVLAFFDNKGVIYMITFPGAPLSLGTTSSKP
jgi:hypothetical protein